MRAIDGASHQDHLLLQSNGMNGDVRKHMLAGLAIARRSLANALDDAALGVNIAPETIAELERTVNDYVRMLDGS